MPRLLELADLFDCQSEVSWGETKADSTEQLSPLTPEERPEGFDKWVEKRQREYRAGRHHARRALSAWGVQDFSVRRSGERLPLFPAALSGSITHTGRQTTFAAAVVSAAETPVGIDAEELRSLSQNVAARVVLPEEERALRPLREESELWSDAGRRALLAFSAKEAFYKCVYPTLRATMEFHDLSLEHLQPGRLRVRVVGAVDARVPRALEGRYRFNEQHLACGFSWQNSAARG